MKKLTIILTSITIIIASLAGAWWANQSALLPEIFVQQGDVMCNGNENVTGINYTTRRDGSKSFHYIANKSTMWTWTHKDGDQPYWKNYPGIPGQGQHVADNPLFNGSQTPGYGPCYGKTH